MTTANAEHAEHAEKSFSVQNPKAERRKPRRCKVVDAGPQNVD